MAKKQQDILDRVLASLSIRGILLHPTTMFLAATAILIGGAIFLWENQHEEIANREEFRLTEENIRLTPQPEWAATDLKQLVLSESQQQGDTSILDTQLVPRTASVMRKVGFVERIQSIEKSKSGLDIDVVYRTPIALVELSRFTMMKKWSTANHDKTVLLPVDRNGYLMPESVGDGAQLPWIAILYPAPFTTTWTQWPDQRITDAAAIGELLERSRFGIKRITTQRFRQSESVQASIPFELYSDSGTQIVWGSAPGKERDPEVNSDAKLRVLDALVTQYGRLDKTNLGRIDIRSGKAVSAGTAKTAVNPDGLFQELK